MATADSVYKFLIKTEGAEAAAADFALIEAAAKKAGTSVSRFLKTDAGSNLAQSLKNSATAASVLAGETDKVSSSAGKASKAQDSLAASTRRSYFAQTALTTVLSAGINKAFLELVDVTGQAIQRVDLLASFPASISALGLSAKDASDSMAKLTGYIGMIGGNLQEATVSVTRFAEVTKNVKAATAEFVGVNNALIAGGAPAQVQKNALEQLTQAYSRGIPQLIEWRSLMVAMPAQLNLVSKAMGFGNANALGEALTNGKVSIQDFVTELTKLSTGTGPIVAQAQARMTGIEFAFNQFKNALVTGITGIVQAVGRQNIVAFFQLLTEVVKQLAIWAVQAINALISLFNIISKVFGGPQVAHFAGDTANAANNLGAGADNAGDMADNLDDASKAAKKTAGSLAAFDKMNVLTQPSDSGADKKKPGPISPGLDPATAAELGKIFDGLSFSTDNITSKAKILAGILASIAGIKFAQGLLNQFNGLIKTIEETSKNLDNFKKKFTGTDDKKGIFQKAQDSAKGFVSFLGTIGGFIAGIFTNPKLLAAVGGFGRLIFAPVLAAARTFAISLVAIIIGVAEFFAIPFELAAALIAAIVVAIGLTLFLLVKYWDDIYAAIKSAALVSKDFIVGVWQDMVEGIRTAWNFLFDIFAAPITFLIKFAEGIFIALVAIVAIFVQAVVGLFVLLVKGIFTVLGAVAKWVFDNVVTPIVNFFTALWNAVVLATTIAWKIIFDNVLAPVAGWINIHVIQPIATFFKGLWDAVSGFVVSFYNNVVNFLGPLAQWIKVNVVDPIFNFFNGLWNGIRDGLANMINGFGNLLGGLANIIKTPINGIIDLLNLAIRGINKLKVPDWVPGLGGKTPGIPLIPRLAQGGIVDRATLSMVGEQGKEAIVPLENNLEWIDKIADKINASSGGANGQPIYLTVQIGEDKVATKIIDLINEKTQMSGRNAIFV